MKIKLNFKALVQELKRLKIVIRPILAAISVLLIIGFYTGDLGRFVDRHEKTIIKAVRTLFFLPDKNIIFPNYKSQSGKFVNLLKDQWMGDKGNFILVSKKEAPFFNKPSLDMQSTHYGLFYKNNEIDRTNINSINYNLGFYNNIYRIIYISIA